MHRNRQGSESDESPITVEEAIDAEPGKCGGGHDGCSGQPPRRLRQAGSPGVQGESSDYKLLDRE